ncbi:MAG: hypothetical protein ACYS8Z_13140 [Planctomycetota bacterium]
MDELISQEGFTFLYGVLKDLRADIFLLWGIHTIVVVAAVGWLVSLKGRLSKDQKLAAEIGYSAFAFAISWAFIRLYSQYMGVVLDIKRTYPEVASCVPKGGYIYDTLNKDYWYSILRTLTIVAGTYIVIMLVVRSSARKKKQ